ncbi:beta-3 adrenergic receptor [Plakobranchus ocellatus]|uniref:Beta-3 adrenergic receptor n=1 Tax=Plakobranchus ocellatus TaxID=259542 RepID=A0AAV4E3F6_9GAST|nr:beta-3 adrenergic receptor [Plakobranchus ocellatus]
MLNDTVTEASVLQALEENTSLLPFKEVQSFEAHPERNIAFGLAGACANIFTLTLIAFSSSIRKSLKLVIQSLVTNDLAFSFCIIIYGSFTLNDSLGSTRCWGMIYVLIATTFLSYITISYLAIYNYVAVIRPTQFQKLASKKTTVISIVCIWLLSWGISFGLVGWNSHVASCNIYVWFTRTKLLVGVFMTIICICCVVFFNVRVIFELHKRKNSRVSVEPIVEFRNRRAPLSLAIASTTIRQAEAASEQHESQGFKDPMRSYDGFRDNSNESRDCENKPEILLGFRRWKNDPRTIMTIPRTSAVDLHVGEGSGTQRQMRISSSNNVSAQRIRKTSATLSILTIWYCLMLLPTVIFILVNVTVDNKQASFLRVLRVFSSTTLVISYLSNPILYAWRLVGWAAVKNKILSCKD